MSRRALLPLVLLLALIWTPACASKDYYSVPEMPYVLGSPPEEQETQLAIREPVLLTIYDLRGIDGDDDEEGQLAAEERGEQDPYADYDPMLRDDRFDTTVTVEREVVEEWIATDPNNVPWSGGPVPAGYEGPVSDPF